MAAGRIWSGSQPGSADRRLERGFQGRAIELVVLASGFGGGPVAQVAFPTPSFGSLELVDDLAQHVAELAVGKPSAGYGNLRGWHARRRPSSAYAPRQAESPAGCADRGFLLFAAQRSLRHLFPLQHIGSLLLIQSCTLAKSACASALSFDIARTGVRRSEGGKTEADRKTASGHDAGNRPGIAPCLCGVDCRIAE